MPSDFPGLTRRGFLGATATAAGAFVLAGCSPLASGVLGSEETTGATTFWNLWAGSDGDLAQKMYDRYRSMYGASSLEAVTFTWGNPYYTKLSLATLGNRPPDIAVAHVSRLRSLRDAGLIEPMDTATMTAGRLAATDFSPPVWDAALIDGQAFCLPYDVGPVVLFYNTEICGKAGLLDSQGVLKPLKGVDAFNGALRAGVAAGAKHGAVWAIINDPAMNWRLFSSLYTQMGGPPFVSEGGRTVTLDDDLAGQALDYLARMTGPSGLVPSAMDYAGANSAFRAGDAAFLVMGCWEVFSMTEAAVPFGMATLPQLFERPAAWADSHVLVLPAKARTATELTLTMRFARSLLDQQLTWAEGGPIPSTTAALNSPDYRNLGPQSSYADSSDIAVFDPAAWYGGAGSIFMTITGSQIALAQQGLTSVSDAVASMRSQLSAYAMTPDPL